MTVPDKMNVLPFVRKHLEAICRRLGVSSRTAAVTSAFPQQVTV